MKEFPNIVIAGWTCRQTARKRKLAHEYRIEVLPIEG